MAGPLKYQRKIIGVERKLGFLYVPVQAQHLMPIRSGKVLVLLEGESRSIELSYNNDYNRIFGLTKWYKKMGIELGIELDVEVSSSLIRISRSNINLNTEIKLGQEVIDVVDISGLSSAEKGNIGEDRAKELILLYGQGLLNVFKPVIDNRGIDLIVLREGVFLPIYLQVKSRFNVKRDDQLVLTISGNTFRSHHAFFILGVSFNPQTLELDDKILCLPSKDLERLGVKLSYKNNLRVAVPYNSTTQSKFAKYFIKKSELVEKLVDKFEAMAELIR